MHEETRPDWYFESPQTAEGGGDEVENEYQVFDMLRGGSQQDSTIIKNKSPSCRSYKNFVGFGQNLNAAADSSKIATNEDQNRTDWNGSI